MEELLMEFLRNRVTELRILKNVSEYTMSLDLGYSRGYVQNITSGRTMPSMRGFFSICDYFNISPRDFFDPAKKRSEAEEIMCDFLVRLPKTDVDHLISEAAFLYEKIRNNNK